MQTQTAAIFSEKSAQYPKHQNIPNPASSKQLKTVFETKKTSSKNGQLRALNRKQARRT